MLVYLAAEDQYIAIDFREKAPAAADRDMFLDAEGEVDGQAEKFSYLSSGVPGTVAGLAHASTKYGVLPWARLLQESIALAKSGIKVSYDLAENLKKRQGWLTQHAATAEIFYKPGGVPYEPGELLIQKDLANTLKLLAEQGADAFYKGDIAARIVADMKAGGGLISMADLAAYRVAERPAIRSRYRDYEYISMPPPSSGGVHIAQMLNILEQYDIRAMGYGSADSIHLMTEAMKLAYSDRSQYLGDPDFFDVPVQELTSRDYARRQSAGISRRKARPSKRIRPGQVPLAESPSTTHLSVMDAEGNAVVLTTTLNFSYGSGIVIRGTGMLMNNEMADFSAKAGAPNAFGLLGGEANQIEPAKRPLSSMAPSMLLRDGKPYLLTGSPGGSRILTTVLQMIVNLVDFEMNVAEATASPRFHHQWLPDRLYMEEGFSPDTIRILKARGHTIVDSQSMGSLQSILYEAGYFYGASDSRRPEAGAVPASKPASLPSR